MDTDVTFIKKTLRSLLISSKEGLTLQQLLRDYKDIIGKTLPYESLGYRRCEELLKEWRDVCCQTYNKEGEQIYKGVADENTAHVAALVSAQKSKKRKPASKFSKAYRRPTSNYSYRPASKYVPQRPYNSRFNPGNSFNKPLRSNSPPSRYSSSSSSWKPAQREAFQRTASHDSSRPTQHEHNRGSAFSRLGSVDSASTQRNTSQAITPKPQTPAVEHSVELVQRNIKSIMDKYNGGVWLHLLNDMYSGEFNTRIPPACLEQIPQWTNIVDPENMNGKIILYKAKTNKAPSTNTNNKQAASNNTTTSMAASGESFTGILIDGPESLPLQKPTFVYISHIDNETGTVYLHIHDSSIETFMATVASHYKAHPGVPPNFVPCNSVCAAKDLTFGAWNRGYVKSVKDNRLQVFFIDYGNTENLEMKMVRPLPSSLASLPAQAIPCTLHNITTNNYNILSKELMAIGKDTKFLAFSEAYNAEEDLSDITLMRLSDDVWVNELLVHMGVASWIQPSRNTSCYAHKHRSADKPALPSATVPTSVFEEPEVKELAKFKYPDTEFWNVWVVQITSLKELYLVIRDDDMARFDAMLGEDMLAAYSDPAMLRQPPFLDIGAVYVAHSIEDGEAVWSRVRVIQITDRQTAECFYIDLGYSESVSIASIYELSGKYMKIPAQVHKCLMYGLDHIEQTDALLQKLTELTARDVLIAQVISIENGVPHIVLFDTTGEDDIEINQEIGKFVEDRDLAVSLPKVGDSMNGYLTYVDEDGTFYFQPSGPGTAILNEFMSGINESLKNTRAEDFISQPSVGEVVCSKYGGNWYRAIVKDVLPDKKVKVWYCDFGNRDTVANSSLRKIPSSIPHALTLPPQVVLCRLNSITGVLNEEMIAHCTTIIESEISLRLVTCQEASDDHPVEVELIRDENGIPQIINHELISVMASSQPLQSLSSTPERYSWTPDRPAYKKPVAVLGSPPSPADSSLLTPPPVSKMPPDIFEINPTYTKERIFAPPRPNEQPPPPISHSASSQQPIKSKRPSEQTPCTPSEQPIKSTHTARPMKTSETCSLPDIPTPIDFTGDTAHLGLSQLSLNQTSAIATRPGRIKLPKAGDIVDVCIIESNFPSDFIVVPSQYAVPLEEMTSELTRHIQSEPALPERVAVKVGDLVACKWMDEIWYRGEVQEKVIDDQRLMLFVDHGTYSFVTTDQIRPLPDMFAALPLLAIRTSIQGLVPPKGEMIWSDEARHAFQTLTREKFLQARVVEARATSLSDGEPMLTITDLHIKGNPETNIGNLLIGQKLANRVM